MMGKARAERGFTLLEILVAIVILGMGLLGMLGVILNSLKLSSSSSYRVVAEQQAYSMAEVLRANTSMLGFSSPAAPTGNAYACFGTTGCSAADYLGSAYQICDGLELHFR
jgi:type IV pilus assembly protein PilV